MRFSVRVKLSPFNRRSVNLSVHSIFGKIPLKFWRSSFVNARPNGTNVSLAAASALPSPRSNQSLGILWQAGDDTQRSFSVGFLRSPDGALKNVRASDPAGPRMPSEQLFSRLTGRLRGKS